MLSSATQRLGPREAGLVSSGAARTGPGKTRADDDLARRSAWRHRSKRNELRTFPHSHADEVVRARDAHNPVEQHSARYDDRRR